MKLSIDQFRTLTRNFLTEGLEGNEKKNLREQWGSGTETGSSLIEFAKGYASLGGAVQQQVDEIIATYINRGGPGSEAWEDVVYNQNPNAIELAQERLGSSLRNVAGGGADEEAEMLMDVLEAAMKEFSGTEE